MIDKEKNKGLVLEIQRMSTEDGPGIRTTVFMKGCTLKCSWCHNPESISLKPQVHWIGSRCIGCKTCVDICEKKALSFHESGLVIDRDICNGCGLCCEKCPSTAMELLGTMWRAEDLAAELAKDKSFFEKSGGGVTIGGGESTLQLNFVKSLLEDLNGRGIHTALDTCGETRRDNLEALIPLADLILLDIKEIDSDLHKEFTGASNEKILENAVYISNFMKNHLKPKELWIRTPLIPGATAREENVIGIGRFIAENLSETVTRWDLLAFNNLCKDKYSRLGLTWKHQDSNLLTVQEIDQLRAAVSISGVDESIVNFTGATALEDSPSEESKIKLNVPKKIQC
jgi:pyruvate formate lyase activating enzyme